jgi:hypothetical protein
MAGQAGPIRRLRGGFRNIFGNILRRIWRLRGRLPAHEVAHGALHDVGRRAVSAVLVYEGVPIRRRDEKLNLTDMWRSAGADPSKRAPEWGRLPSTIEFAEHIGSVVGKSHDELFQIVRGGPETATYAHWQMGMAYAKYLSPSFHAWCNEVVRGYMGKWQKPRHC